MPTADYPSLSRWLLGQSPPPRANVLRAAQLAAYAYTVLPRSDALRAPLRPDYAAQHGRHYRIKAELQPLLRAWRSARIDVLIFKGFQLAEFVYDEPGARFYGDVDLLIRPRDVTRAARLAGELGWHTAFPVTWRLRPSHNAVILGRPGGAAQIDVHQCALHIDLPWHRAQDRITEALWASSAVRRWDDVDVREPSPVDMLLVGLVLQRAWSDEQWQPKPHDAADVRAIAKRHGVTRAALVTRARELRCERTLNAFLERCDPEGGRLDLAPPPSKVRRRLNRRAFVERGPLGATQSWLARAGGAVPSMSVAVRFVPLVLGVRRTLRRHADLRTLMTALTAYADATPRRGARLGRHHVVMGVHWATRLVGAGPYGGCLVRALAAYVGLRRHGHAVEFVSGVRRDGPRIVGHAWLERDGRPLLEAERADLRPPFEASFRFPGPLQRWPVSAERQPLPL